MFHSPDHDHQIHQEITVAHRVLRSPNGLILRDIALPGVAGVIWQRPRDADFAAWIDALPDTCLPSLHRVIAAGAVEAAIHAACDQAGMPAGPMRNRLASDAAALAFLFAGIMNSPVLNLRLHPVLPQGTPFGVDRLRARLLCGYRGAGVELASASEARDVVAQVRLEPGTAIVMRGVLWPGHEVTGLVHRLPQARTTGLMLSLDPARDEQTAGVN